ncbi:hypothetical protein [Brevundimonas sp. EAKA]|jgi:hypothetical protein|nr:hypothetical protein [Brevundimonas sp. EAKA]
MTTTLFDEDGVVLIKRDDRYYVRYDAGTHMVLLREDEVTSEDAKRLMRGDPYATEVLFDLQRRLLAAGEDPYVSNIA